MFIAVETSDLVHSTNMSEAKYGKAILCLKAELASQRAIFHTEYEIFRGDAFQVIYKNPSHALRALLMTRLKLLYVIDSSPIEITQALAFGYQHADINKLSENMGDVFIASGRLLDDLKRRQLGFHTPTNHAAVSLIQAFLNAHLTGLTQKQAEVLYYYLHENFPEQQTIADKLAITRQNVAAHLKRGGADLLKQTIEFFETLCEDAKL